MTAQRKLLLRIPRRALVMFAREKHQDVTDNRGCAELHGLRQQPSYGIAAKFIII